MKKQRGDAPVAVLVVALLLVVALGGLLVAAQRGALNKFLPRPTGERQTETGGPTVTLNEAPAAPRTRPSVQLTELQNAFVEIANIVKPAVVNINTTSKNVGPHSYGVPEFREYFGEDYMDRFGPPQEAQAMGSGFIVDGKGYVVTNNHVIQGASDISVSLNDGRAYKAKLVGTDNKTDLAVLKIDAGRKLPSVTFGDSDAINVGEWVVAVGNPFGLEQTVTAGIVSAKGRSIGQGPYDDFIQTDAAINPGNSGGPLADIDGNIIGVNTAIFSRSGGYMGIGFAIPSNMAKKVIKQLIEKGEVVRGWLGIAIGELKPDEMKKRGVSGGVAIADVYRGHPAYEAGILPGDVIVEFDGKKVDSVKELQRLVAGTPIGKSADVVVVRGSTRKTLKVEVAKMPDDLSTLERHMPQQR